MLQEMLAVPTARQQQRGRSLKRYASFLSEVILTLFRSDQIFCVLFQQRVPVIDKPPALAAARRGAEHPVFLGHQLRAIHGADTICFYSSSLMGRRDAACWQSSAEPTTKLQCRCGDIQEKQADHPVFCSSNQLHTCLHTVREVVTRASSECAACLQPLVKRK